MRSNVLKPLISKEDPVIVSHVLHLEMKYIIDISSIRGRNTIVEALLRNNGVFVDVVGKLTEFPDLDKMLNSLLYSPKSITATTMRSSIDALIYIKHTVLVSISLAEIVWKLQNDFDVNESDGFYAHSLVSNVINQLNNSRLDSIQTEITQLLYENSQYSKSPHEMRFQECFAIKNGVHGKLDVLRKTYLEGVEEMNQVIVLPMW